MLRQVRLLHTIGIHWLSETFYWAMLEPERGRFDWRRSDALMTAAATTGTDVLAVLAYSAPWASSDPSPRHSPDFPPRDQSDYAEYASAVVQRYGPAGAFWSSHTGLPSRPLRTVEIWNEPWWHGFWRPQPDAGAYAALVRTAGSSIRRVAPSVTILVSGDLTQPTDPGAPPWLAGLLAARPSVAPYVDAWSVHPYPDPKSLGPADGPVESSFQRVPLIWRMVKAARLTRPLWITEVGWSSATAAAEGVTELDQARYLHDALGEAVTSWRSFVVRTFVYSWGVDTGNSSDLEGHFALYDARGHPKPALGALRAVVRGS